MIEKDSAQIVIHTLFKNRLKLLVFSLFFGSLALGITWFIPKKYTAQGIVFPTNSNSIKSETNNTFFGYEFQADRLIQVFQSQKMRETIVNRFDLVSYYEIDTNSLNWPYYLNKYYEKDITFSRTKFISVAVEVQMKSPELARDIANTIMTYVDTIRKEILYENVYALQKDLSEKVDAHQSIVDSLLFMLSQETSVVKPNQLAKNLIAKLEENNKKGNLGLGDEMVVNAALNNYTFQNAKVINEYYHQLSVLSNLKKELVQLNEKTSMPFPKIYRVQNAIADYKKTSPSYLINGLLGFVLGAVVSVLFVMITVKWKDLSSHLSDD